MDIFLDTADLKEVEELVATGLVNGITTNPSLAAAAGMDFLTMVKKMCLLVQGPVSAEVVALDAKGMIEQGKKLAGIAENVVVKVPLTMEGLTACSALSSQDIMVNVTLCFSLNQAILASNAGAAFISPFIGRLDDIGQDGFQLIADIAQYHKVSFSETSILAASIRNPFQVSKVALSGADVVTIPPKIFRDMMRHDLTDQGLTRFMNDWQKSGLSI